MEAEYGMRVVILFIPSDPLSQSEKATARLTICEHFHASYEAIFGEVSCSTDSSPSSHRAL